MEHVLEIKDLHVYAGDKAILKGIDLVVKSDEIHAIMGPNGNGKSTLLATIMGHPAYQVTKGSILFDGEDVLAMSVDERSRKGLFLALQYPKEISGVTNSDFLRAAMNARSAKPLSLFQFIKEIDKGIQQLKMKEDLAHRFVNDGFSGGEKKRNEILQMMLLKPEIALLDEIDSGLDVDAIRIVSEAIIKMKEETHLGLMVVSHYERFFTALKPTHAHVIIDGRIVYEGGEDLVYKIDNEGYDWLYDTLHLEKKQDKRKAPLSLGSCAHNKAGKNE